MKINFRKKPLTFGGCITATHDAWDGRLVEQYVAPKMPSWPAGNVVPTAWHETGFTVRIIAKLRAAIESQVSVGYEDETGFHYGVKTDE
jgi:hypothetical protein